MTDETRDGEAARAEYPQEPGFYAKGSRLWAAEQIQDGKRVAFAAGRAQMRTEIEAKFADPSMKSWTLAMTRTRIRELEAMHDDAMAGWKSCVIKQQNVKARVSAFEAALGFDTPWPIHEVLARLADAADHLLRIHDCDAHGHELVRSAEQAARRIVRTLLANNPETQGKGESDGK